MGATDITRAFCMPLVYMFVMWVLVWVLVGFLKLPTHSGNTIALYIVFVLSILIERSTPTSSKGGR